MRTRIGVLALVGLLVLASAPFAVGVSPGDGRAAVDFDDTIAVGVSEGVVREAQRSSLVIPKAQVFYSQYRYPVGYYGVTSLVTDLRTGGDRGLGVPLQVYVTDFSGEPVRVDEDGTLRLAEARKAGWVRATEAFFVVDGRARIPTRESVVVPFSARADAAAFADRTGGRVVDWDAVRSRRTDPIGHTAAEWRRTVERRRTETDAAVADRRALLDRPVSVVVGADAPTLAAAVRRAPPNTTVRVPRGTYDVGNVTVRKPLTIRGAGPNRTRLDGGGAGSVLKATADRVAVADLSISGVGPVRSGANATPETIAVEAASWNYDMRRVHGYGDAAVVLAEAEDALVSRVRINTTSNGVIARDSPGLVVSNLTLYGTKRWEDGFLGVAVIGAPAVVQDSRFYGGKVGVFALDVADLAVRRSRMEGMMLGVFNLYGRELLIRDNDVEDVGYGIYVEMRSRGTAVVGNDVTGADNGIIVAGTDNYVARNVLAGNGHALLVEGHYSLYRRNVVVANDVGLRSLTLLPTNTVTGNDVVGNAEPATAASFDVVHTWRGNYWSRAPGLRRAANGRLVRPYRPTSPVDGAVGRVPYAGTVARSPTVTLLRQLGGVVPGLRGGGIVDPAPRATPVRETAIERARRAANRTESDDAWEFLP
ncbi:MAG: NosD domain-containing protein [Halobellus sp.]